MRITSQPNRFEARARFARFPIAAAQQAAAHYSRRRFLLIIIMIIILQSNAVCVSVFVYVRCERTSEAATVAWAFL